MKDNICPACFKPMGIEHHSYPLYTATAPFDDAHARYVCTNPDCECCLVDDNEDSDPYYS